MSKPKAMQAQIAYGKPEELTNIITHAVGAALGFVGLVFLLLKTTDNGYGGAAHFAVFLFGFAAIAMFTVSALHHAMRSGSAARCALYRFDHCIVAALMLGVYAPIMLIGMQMGTQTDGIWGYTLFAVIAAMLAVSMALNAIDARAYKVIALVAYIVMGWACVVRIDRIAALCGMDFFRYLFGGSTAYFVGIVFCALKKIPFNHALWHVLVVIGAALHFVGLYCCLL